MKTETIKAKLENISRYDNSRNGNPRYLIIINNTLYYTGVDCSLGYSLPNFEGKEVIIEWQWLRNKRVIESCKLGSIKC